MRILIMTILFTFTVTIFGCSSKGNCFTSDSVEQMKKFDQKNIRYSLFLRVSGLHEKEAFYELYKGVPFFNECSQPNVHAVASIHIDTKQGEISKLIIDGEKLDLVYKTRDDKASSLRDIDVELIER